MKNEIIVFEDEEIKLDVNVDSDTVWLTANQMGKLFKTTAKNIRMHVNNIFKEGELEEDSVRKDFFLTASDGKQYRTKYHDWDMIISVGYRVKSKRGIKFRKWATNVLKNYIIEGYAVNPQRLDYLEKTVKLIEIANRNEYQELDEAANFLYLVVKNHVFIDGNKRIGAALFIYFLQFYNILKKDNQNVIDNNTLVALTLLIANSDPNEQQIMVDLIMNFLV